MSQVQEFYEGKCVLVTGVTGFVGKFLLEKLLRSCKPSAVYVLIRPKKGLSPEQRLHQFLQTQPVFQFHPLDEDSVRKVIAIDGDVETQAVCSQRQDLLEILSRVQVVIHSAASVRFDETFEDAFRANSGGTANILNLCRSISSLSAFVYVSTYATQVHRKQISESVTSMVPGLEEGIRCNGINDLKWMEDLCRPHAQVAPNAYTFTKNVAEVMVQVVCEEAGIPTVILRPPVVVAPAREPEPGFVDDTRQAIVSFALAVYLGLTVSVVCDGSQRFIYNNVDVVVNAILVSAWHVTGEKGVCVLNVCKQGEAFNDWLEKIIRSGQKYPSLKSLRPLHVFKARSDSLRQKVDKLLFHYLFALLVDVRLFVSGKKMMMYSSIVKMERVQEMGSRVLFRTDCQVEDPQFQQMNARLSPRDRHTFCLESEDLSQEFMDRCCLSFRKYILKEEIETLAEARRRVRRKSIMIRVANVGLLLLLVYAVYAGAVALFY